jgi:hypothetical protein
LLVWRRLLTAVGHKVELVARSISRNPSETPGLHKIGQVELRFLAETQLLIL